jgi:Protein of unknown function (DUF3365)
MHRDRFGSVGIAAVMVLLAIPASTVFGNEDVIQAGRLLAILLDSGRVTIGSNQPLINDASKGYKGFTADVFEEQLLATFQARTGIDLRDLSRAAIPETAKPLLARLIEESKKTVTSYQPAINVAGLKYKGLIPATFGTETAARFRAWSGVYIKQTAPDHLLRNPKNKPDEYEAMLFQKLSNNGDPEHNDAVMSETVDGQSIRVLLPLFYTRACLSCHGEPKGERDISGYPKEGGKEGQLAGGISVKIDLK